MPAHAIALFASESFVVCGCMGAELEFVKEEIALLTPRSKASRQRERHRFLSAE
eukprot:SAG31_NODE_2482_length_5634_cov_1.887805_7_plen_54_part_00